MKYGTSKAQLLLVFLCTIASPRFLEGQTDSALSLESGYVEVDAGRIFYEAKGSGPALIMIHDGLLHRETWDAQFDEFAGAQRVIRWDRRGYGRSDEPRAPFSNREDLMAVFKSLGITRATLMGCSSGGLLATEFALDHPEMVSGLILVGPIVSGFGFSEHFRTRGNRGVPDRDAPIDQKIHYWTSLDPWILAPKNQAARETMKTLLEANPQNLEGSRGLSLPPGQPTFKRLSSIRVPALIVAGESDIPDVHTHIGAIHAAIEGSEHVVLAHSGHLCHLEVPDVFNQIVGEFLRRID